MFCLSVRFCHGKGLSFDKLTRKLWMLEEVPTTQMSPTSGDARPVDVVGSERIWQVTKSPREGFDVVEHLPVATRGNASTSDDVRAIRSMCPSRSNEFVFGLECARQFVSEVACCLSREVVRLGPDLKCDLVGAVWVYSRDATREFLDQECVGSDSSFSLK